MRHRCPNFAAVSLLVSILIAGLWIRSRVVDDRCAIECNKGDGVPIWEIYFQSSSRIKAGYTRFVSADDPDFVGAKANLRFEWSHDGADGGPSPGSIWNQLGFSADNNVGLGSNDYSVGIPFWFPLTLAILFPVAWLGRRMPLWQSGNRCRSCGYNLTGNISGVCPECGAPVPEKFRNLTAK